jgi:hypothetical protein
MNFHLRNIVCLKTPKAIRVLLVALAACWCLTGFSQTTNSFFQFVQDQSKRQYTQVPHEVLAVYYPWYGEPDRPGWKNADTDTHQIANTAHYPIKGPYSSHDTTVLDWQIEQAKSHGITGFVVSWMGTGPDAAWMNQSLPLLLDLAEKKGFKISIYWERAPGTGQGQIDRAATEISYVLNNYGSSNAFLKVEGKPVIFAYARVLEQVSLDLWPGIIQSIRQKGGDFVLMSDGYQASYAYLFDGMHTYDPANFSPGAFYLRTDNLDDVRTLAARYYATGTKLARLHGRINCAVVNPGFDARKAYSINYQSDRRDGQTYRTMWEEAIKTNPDWIMITTWNEWLEGTEIEPSLELGDKYLQITAEYAKRFLDSPPVKVPPSTVTFPKFVPGTALEVDKLLAGRKVGVLMEDRMNDSEFWAAYCGASLQRLTWKDLIDSKLFNASNFPVLIQIGKEHYTSSVKVTDDVTRSLVRYLREGGFLVSLPTGTWPLYYDDSRKGIPYAITDALAMGVNGFDHPPAGTKLKFYVNKSAWLGLPPTAPFPTNGDLRFTPASRSRVPSADYYLPLVQLWDAQMHFQGDAAIYIRHNAPPLSPGKSIYVWMRTAEALGSDEFYPSLYQFISTKLKPLPTDR